MKKTSIILIFIFSLMSINGFTQASADKVSEATMNDIYEAIKTPFKYGLVMIPTDSTKKMDCPSIFRKGKKWFMTYLVYDGRGYETWLAESRDLLNWKHLGKIMSFSDSVQWDYNQKAGYIALQDHEWGGSYAWQKFDDKYWMSYFGGNKKGYEAGLLSMGIAFTDKDPSTVQEWKRLDKPVLMPTDKDVRWWENSTMYKSSVIWDKTKSTGYPFIMYYNARGDSLKPARGAERIGIAVSNNMVDWKRFGKDPVINHHKGISGDAYLQKIKNTWVMFYFGAFWKDRPTAFNRFACSNDLVHWTEWTGEDLIKPTEPYDALFAHKSFVIKYKGIVYHFYCAVNKKDDRGIAVATSKDLGKSQLNFRSK